MLVGCGGPVEIATPDLADAEREACEAFVADLPPELADQEAVEVEPDDALGGAYGDPPIVVRCGVEEPDGFGPGVPCEVANGVRWHIPTEQYDDSARDLTLTSAWTEPRVEVFVPQEYWPEGGASAMAVLAPLVEEHLRRLPGRCL